MISWIFYLGVGAWAGYLLNRYRVKRNKKDLKSAGTLVLVITFFVTMGLGIDAVLFPEKADRIYIALFAGALAGGALMAAGYEGWRKVYALAQVILFLAAANFLALCMNYFEKVIVHGYASGLAVKLVPESGDTLMAALPPEKKIELAGRLGRAITAAQDSYERIGFLYKLQNMAAYAGPALPAVIPLIESARGNEFDVVVRLLVAMGPLAAEAAPALQARRLRAEAYETYRIDDALKAINPAPKTI